MLIFFTGAATASGVSWIWRFVPTLIEKESSGKIALLGTSVALPFTCVSIFAIALINNWRAEDQVKRTEFPNLVVEGSLVSVCASFVGLAVGLVLDLSLRKSVCVSAGAFALFLLGLILCDAFSRRRSA